MDIKKYALESVPDTIIQIFDKELVIIDVFGVAKLNQSGYEKGALKKKSIDDAYPNEIVLLYKPFWLMALDGKSNTFDMQHGQITWNQIFTPVLNQNGNIIGGMVISKDITEQYQKDKLIKKHQEHLFKIADLANHKLRAPVARIDGLLNIILEHKVEFSDDVKTLLQTMSVPVFELYEIIKNINDLSDEDFIFP